MLCSGNITIGTFYFLFSRVFYLLDTLFPTKQEIILNSEDKVHPPEYALGLLPTALTPTFTNRQLNSGSYKLLHSEGPVAIYYYRFPTTTGASKATKETLEYDRLSFECDIDLDTVLPKCDLQFRNYEVPYKFIGVPDVLIIAQQAQEKGRQEGREDICALLKENFPDALCQIQINLPALASQPAFTQPSS